MKWSVFKNTGTDEAQRAEQFTPKIEKAAGRIQHHNQEEIQLWLAHKERFSELKNCQKHIRTSTLPPAQSLFKELKRTDDATKQTLAQVSAWNTQTKTLQEELHALEAQVTRAAHELSSQAILARRATK